MIIIKNHFVIYMKRGLNMETTLSYEKFFQKSTEVYSWLEDDISKQVFELKLLWSITNEIRLLSQLSNICLLDVLHNGIKRIKRSELRFVENDTIIIYGILNAGEVLLNELRSVSKCKILFCDKNYKKTPEFLGVEVISPNELIEKYKDAKVFVSTNEGSKVICEFLKEKQFKNYYTYLYEKRYFDDIIKFTEQEVFVDCGVFDAETSILFSKMVQKNINTFIYLNRILKTGIWQNIT